MGELGTTLQGMINDSGTAVNDAVGADGAIDSIVKGLANAANLNLLIAQVDLSGGTAKVNGVDSALEDAAKTLIEEPLVDDSGIVSIDLKNGDVKIDLAKIVKGEGGSDLNGLDPNTQVLSSSTLKKITEAVEGALGTVTSKATTAVTDVVNNLELDITVPAKLRVGLFLRSQPRRTSPLQSMERWASSQARPTVIL